MKTPSINLKRTLDVTIKDTLCRIKALDDRDRQALTEEYKEWLDARKKGSKQPHVLYMNLIRSIN